MVVMDSLQDVKDVLLPMMHTLSVCYHGSMHTVHAALSHRDSATAVLAQLCIASSYATTSTTPSYVASASHVLLVVQLS